MLNEIQDAIEDTFYYNIENLGCGSYALKKGCEIYEMPQDEDIETLEDMYNDDSNEGEDF